MKKVYLLFSAFVFFSATANAQNSSALPAKKKAHYRIISNGTEDPLWVEKAMYHANVDSLRFVHERRRLPIEGSSIVLELFSADELQQEYQRPVHPLNIGDSSRARKYKLRLENGMFTAIPVK